MADNDTVTPILADDGDDIAPALYPNSTRQFGKGNLTSQRRVVGWKTHRRGSDGRRFFTAQFKQEQIARVVRHRHG